MKEGENNEEFDKTICNGASRLGDFIEVGAV